jgi:nitric oxide reductase activation protein
MENVEILKYYVDESRARRWYFSLPSLAVFFCLEDSAVLKESNRDDDLSDRRSLEQRVERVERILPAVSRVFLRFGYLAFVAASTEDVVRLSCCRFFI